MDIIVTTPKSEMKNAAKEALNAKEFGVSHYFRRLSTYPSKLNIGDKVFYTEDGYIRGFAIVEAISDRKGKICSTTKKEYPEGFFIWMKCNSWKWIKPIAMKGFQNYRYVTTQDDQFEVGGIKAGLVKKSCHIEYDVVGTWLDPKPKIN